MVVVARRTKTPHRISGCAHTVPRGFRVLGGARRPIARRPPLAVVAQPLQMSRRIVLPGGDPTKTSVLAGAYLVGADGSYVVPHLALEDVNGDGSADLLLQVRDEVVVYLNENGTFRLITSAERARLVPSGMQGR